MYGVCDKCGQRAELDCWYNNSSGEELWLCPYCSEIVNEEQNDE